MEAGRSVEPSFRPAEFDSQALHHKGEAQRMRNGLQTRQVQVRLLSPLPLRVVPGTRPGLISQGNGQFNSATRNHLGG